LAGKETPTREERNRAWNSCAFTNYIMETVGEGARERPSRPMLIDAQSPFLELLEEIKPRRIVAFGKHHMWPNMPECEVHLTDDLQAYQRRDGALAWTMCLAHPAGRGSVDWKILARAIGVFKSLNLPEHISELETIGQT
jgi:hypothetical protein